VIMGDGPVKATDVAIFTSGHSSRKISRNSVGQEAKPVPIPLTSPVLGQTTKDTYGQAKVAQKPVGQADPPVTQQLVGGQELGIKTSGPQLSPLRTLQVWNPQALPWFYDARFDVTKSFNFLEIIAAAPEIWRRPVGEDIRDRLRTNFLRLGGRADETYGQLFTRIGEEMGVDPYAMAAACVFESYNSETSSFNPHMQDVAGHMHAAGIAATQAQDVKGSQVPGLKLRLPQSRAAAATHLRSSPELSVRFFAAELRTALRVDGDLGRALVRVAVPDWRDPMRARGNYGTQAQYQSRLYALYQAFRAAERQGR
jgi:hypothetical protein